MKNSNHDLEKKNYLKPEINSYEVEQDAYAMGSPCDRTKLLECSTFFGCCDSNIWPF